MKTWSEWVLTVSLASGLLLLAYSVSLSFASGLSLSTGLVASVFSFPHRCPHCLEVSGVSTWFYLEPVRVFIRFLVSL